MGEVQKEIKKLLREEFLRWNYKRYDLFSTGMGSGPAGELGAAWLRMSNICKTKVNGQETWLDLITERPVSVNFGKNRTLGRVKMNISS